MSLAQLKRSFTHRHQETHGVTLHVNEGWRERQVCVEHLPAMIGRSEQADVAIRDRWVSRVHCQLYYAGDQLMLRDLESHNGTWLNAKRITESPIRPGDRICIGTSTLTLQKQSS